jgi:hypothetical protein
LQQSSRGADEFVEDATANGAKVKYRDPKTNKTWSGRGRLANWLKKEQDAGGCPEIPGPGAGLANDFFFKVDDAAVFPFNASLERDDGRSAVEGSSGACNRDRSLPIEHQRLHH